MLLIFHLLYYGVSSLIYANIIIHVATVYPITIIISFHVRSRIGGSNLHTELQGGKAQETRPGMSQKHTR